MVEVGIVDKVASLEGNFRMRLVILPKEPENS